MAEAVRIRRKNKFNFVKEAAKLQSFDEFPMLSAEIDPQLHESHNTVDQPFYLRSAKDSVIAQPTGASRIEFRDGPVRYFDTVPGDYVYVPAGQAHRLSVLQPGISLRYKARAWGGEEVLWYCSACDGELFGWNIEDEGQPVQAGYADACDAFNASEAARTCRRCGSVHSPVDLGPFRWRAVAEAIRSQGEDEDF